MTKKLFALYFRLVFTSPVVWAFYVVTAGFMAFIMIIIGMDGGYDNFYALIHSLAYVEMIIVCFAFCSAVVFARKKSTLEIACLVPKEKASLICVLALIFASWLVCLLPTTYCIVMSIIQHISAEFCIRVIIYTLLRWMTMLTFMVSMGFLLGRVVKSAFVFLLSAPVAILFSNFNETVLGKFGIDTVAIEKVSTLLSIHHLYVTSAFADFSAPDIDLLFLCKICACLVFGAILIYTIYITSKKRRRATHYVGLVALVALFSFSAYFYVQLFPERYFPEDKLFIFSEDVSTYAISSYSGDVELSEFSRFDCTVTVKGDGSGTPLKLRLDEALEPQSVSCDGTDVSYQRDGNYIIIDDPLVTANTKSDIDIRCSGRIFYFDNIMPTVDIFVSASCAALPPTYAFLPTIEGDNGIKVYDLTVKAGNTVVSNLDVQKTEKGSYSLKGESNLICIYSGNFEETEKDGVTFIRPKDYTTDFDAEYELRANREYWDLDTMTLEEEPPAGQKKVFQMFFYYSIHGYGGFNAWFDDCLIMHHFAI